MMAVESGLSMRTRALDTVVRCGLSMLGGRAPDAAAEVESRKREVSKPGES